MQFAHARDNRLAGLLVGTDPESGVFLGERIKRAAHLLLIHLGTRLHRDVDDRLGKFQRLENYRLVGVAKGVTGGGIL